VPIKFSLVWLIDESTMLDQLREGEKVRIARVERVFILTLTLIP
jgi:hypothetical protein